MEPIRIELPLGIMFHSVNCYLIPGKQLTLVDCGLDTVDNWLLFQKKIAAHGYQFSDIEQIIITHEHPDHIGLLPKIMEHSSAIVRVPKMITPWLKNPNKINDKQTAFIKKMMRSTGMPKGLLEKAYHYFDQIPSFQKFTNLNRFEFFEEGDLIEMGNTEWEALNTPGHWYSQFIFLEKEEKRAFSGDMILPVAPMPIVMEDPNHSGQPIRALKSLLDSFDRLIPYDIQKVYPGHGPIFNNANAMIDRQVKRINKRKSECFELYQSGKKSVYEIHQKMYPEHKLPPNFSGVHMILGYLDLLREEVEF